MRPLITLTTDFGPGSGYVAQMKGVILSICRDAELVDISHEIRPQDIRQGALLLADATPRFPPGTLHAAVVDPGVGTARRILYAEIGLQRYIGPDNGLLSYLAIAERPTRLISVDNPAYWLPNQSHTFHGRDIMAPVAAHLAAGTEPAMIGTAVPEMVRLDWPEPQLAGEELRGQVLIIDSFGNLITNIAHQAVDALAPPAQITVAVAGVRLDGIVPTYGAAAAGTLIALIDSQGRLEIAVVGGSAARLLRVEPGTPVRVRAAGG